MYLYSLKLIRGDQLLDMALGGQGHTGCRPVPFKTCDQCTCKNSKWVWPENTTITNCRQPCGTARKSPSTITRHQEDKLSKAISSLFPIKMIPHLRFVIVVFPDHTHLLFLKVRQILARWVPHLLTDEQNRQWVKVAKKLLQMFQTCDKKQFANVATGDETCVYYFEHVRNVSKKDQGH